MQQMSLKGSRLSPQQDHLWQNQQKKHPVCIMCSVRLEGAINVPLMHAAFQSVVSQHEILHTTFACPTGMDLPLQIVSPTPDFSWQLISLENQSPEVQSAHIAALISALRQQPFNLSAGPLLQVWVLSLNASSCLLLLRLPVLCTDRISLALLVQNVEQAYDELLRGNISSQDPLQYADVAQWQRDLLEAAESSEGIAYWHALQEKKLPVLSLPVAGSPTPFETNTTFDIQVRLDDETVTALKSLHIWSEQVAVVQACWYIFLWRLTGLTELVVNAYTNGRSYEELQDTLGPYARYLPMLVHLEGPQSFHSLLAQVKEVRRQVLCWQDTFIWPQENAQAIWHTSTVGFADEHYTSGLSTGGVRWELEHLLGDEESYDLLLRVKQVNETITLQLTGRAGPCHQHYLEQWTLSLGVLLKAALKQPECPISQLPLLRASQCTYLFETLNQTAADYPDCCLQDMIEQQVARTPTAPAVVCGSHTLRYEQLEAQANQLAHWLIRQGIGPEACVGLWMDRSVAMIVALLGILKAGGAYVPVDAETPSIRLLGQLQRCNVRVLLTQQHLLVKLPAWDGVVLCLDRDAQVLLQEKTSVPAIERCPQQLAYVIYTSGSSGEPKGVAIEQRSLVNYTWGICQRLQLQSGWHLATVSTLAADLGNTIIFPALVTGGCLHILEYEAAMNAEHMATYMQEHTIDVLKITPAHLNALLGAKPDRRLLPRRFLILGGEMLLAELLQRVESLGASCQVINHYGPTETTVGALMYQVARDQPSSWNTASVPIGYPLNNVAVYIMDEQQQPVIMGCVGELYIGGTGLARGYMGQEEETTRRFVMHKHLQTGELRRLYRTGDLVRHLPDGAIEFLGRSDSQIKVRGYRIELNEIISVLRQHPAVRDTIALNQSDEPGQNRLIAYVVPFASSPSTTPASQCYRLPNGLVVFYLNKNETEHLYKQIYEAQLYLKYGITLNDGDCIFDVGANIGLFTLFVHQHCRNATIFAFEPNPHAFVQLQRNVTTHKVDCRTFDYGLAERQKTASFTLYPRVSVMSGFYGDAVEDKQIFRDFMLNPLQRSTEDSALLAEHADELVEERFASETITCRTSTISDVLRENAIQSIDLLKIDAEKSELDILHGVAEQDWPKIKQIVAEVHDIDGRLDYIIALLKRHGFDVMTDQDAMFRGTNICGIYAMARSHRDRNVHAEQLVNGLQQPARIAHNQPPTGEELREFLTQRLPNYMLPSAFVVVDAFPLTPNGKVDIHALTTLAAATKHPALIEAPHGPLAEMLIDIWKSVLKMKNVGLHDNFFDVGGHSLLAVQVISRIRKNVQAEISLRDFFEEPTIAQLVLLVEQQLRNDLAVAALPPLEPVSRLQDLPLSFAQQRLWFLNQLEPDTTSYNKSMPIQLDGILHTMALERSLQTVIQRHELLRTTFQEKAGLPVQVIHPAGPLYFPSIDLHGLEQEAREREVRRLVAQDGGQPFNLARGPLLRAYLLCVDSARHVLFLTMHHIIIDGWSNHVLERELRTLYQSFSTGESVTLPPLPIQYADFAVWQRAWLQGEVLEAQLAYWRRQLAGAPLLALPVDHPRPPVQSHRGAAYPFALPLDLSTDLIALSRREGVTLFMTVLAAFQILFYRYTGQVDIVLGTDSANRNRMEIENIIGFFINLLALRINLSGKPSFREVLSRVREMVLGAYAHQEVPFELLVEKLVPDHPLDHMPLVQVLFVFQNLPTLHQEDVPAIPELVAETVQQSARDTVIGTKFDLVLFVQERAGRIYGALDYSLDLFEPGTIMTMMARFTTLLQDIVKQPATSIDQLAFFTETERMHQEQEEQSLRKQLRARSGQRFNLSGNL